MPKLFRSIWIVCGAAFSVSRGRSFFANIPPRAYPVTIAVGTAVAGNTPAWKLNRIVAELGSDTVPYRYHAGDTLGAVAMRA